MEGLLQLPALAVSLMVRLGVFLVKMRHASPLWWRYSPSRRWTGPISACRRAITEQGVGFGWATGALGSATQCSATRLKGDEGAVYSRQLRRCAM